LYYLGIPWNSADASFEAMLDSHPLDSDAGRDLRKRALDNGVMNYIVACLAIFAHEVNSVTIAVPCKLSFQLQRVQE